VVKLDSSDWSVPHDQLAAAFNERTKLILINSPHNPTGKVFSTEDLQFIGDLCKEWGAYAVLDEVSQSEDARARPSQSCSSAFAANLSLSLLSNTVDKLFCEMDTIKQL
jgi:aspartate/methionine/tyrosine aminotransferase